LLLDLCYNNTNSANHYCPTLQKKCTKTKNKCWVKSLMASFCCVILLIPIVTHRIQDQLNVMQWKVLNHHAYSRELLPCDFPIFGSLQLALIDHTLTFAGYVQVAAGQWFRQHTKEFFAVRTCQIVH